MAKQQSQRNIRSDKFPLTLHPTGQYCKKICGRLYYFGNDRRKALARYLEQATSLHGGRPQQPPCPEAEIAVATLANLYLEQQECRVTAGEIRLRQLHGQIVLLRDFVRRIGRNRLASEICTMDLQNYRNTLIKAGPNLTAVKKIPLPKRERPIFTPDQIRVLINADRPKLEAMILLGLNCGFGGTDCAELRWTDLDLEAGRVRLPRGKTGIKRNLALWPETVQALQGIPRSGELAFYTRDGSPWVKSTTVRGEDGTEKYKERNTVTEEFRRLLAKTGIKTEKGVGFYTLRRTVATFAAQSKDPFAVQRLLGHAVPVKRRRDRLVAVRFAANAPPKGMVRGTGVVGGRLVFRCSTGRRSKSRRPEMIPGQTVAVFNR